MQDISINGLIEDDRVHRSLYTDPQIFELEMERIWGQAWIFIGHDSQVKGAGDYYATTMGRQPVIMVRGEDGEVRVLFNRCPHKGAMLVTEGSGKVDEFRCLYHAWRFKLDGTLVGIPLEQGYENTKMDVDDPSCVNMRPVPRYATYRGFVFASLAANGPDLENWLGGVASSIDNMVDRSPEGALEITGGSFQYLHDCNWKFFVENLNDMMHPMIVHQSSSRVGRVVAKRELGDDETVPPAIEIIAPFTGSYDSFDEMGLHAFPNGHGYSGGKTSIHANYSEVPEYNELMEKAYGKARMEDIFSVNRHNSVFYPSMTLKGAIQTMRVIKPVAVDKTIIESWVFRLVGAPDELLERSVLYCNLINSSANLVGPDDQEAYARQQNGLTAEAQDWVNMQRDTGRDEEIGDNHLYAKGSSDLSFRNQFKAWKKYMGG